MICTATTRDDPCGVTVLLTEDMQDGRTIEGLRLINPFLAANNAAVEALLGI
jgi:predicted nucleic acid-binding protein